MREPLLTPRQGVKLSLVAGRFIALVCGKRNHSRDEDQSGDDERGNCRNKDGPRGDVFGFFNEGMLLGGNEIADRFNRGVDGFETPNRRNRKDQSDPFETVDVEEKPRAHGDHRRKRVNARVVFRSEHRDQTPGCEPERPDPRG